MSLTFTELLAPDDGRRRIDGPVVVGVPRVPKLLSLAESVRRSALERDFCTPALISWPIEAASWLRFARRMRALTPGTIFIVGPVALSSGLITRLAKESLEGVSVYRVALSGRAHRLPMVEDI